MDADALLRYAVAAGIAAGHSPREVRQWSVGDLYHFLTYEIARRQQ